MDVVIIGAGVAGLAAGARLIAAGRTVTLVEARERIGGRILTRFDASVPIAIELGAEFLHGKLPEGMLGRLAVEDVPAPGALGKALDKLVRDVARHPDAPSVGARITAIDASPRDRAFMRAYVEGFHAADPDRFSPRAFVEEERGGEDVLARIPAGYVAVANALAERAGTIRLGVVARRLHHRPHAVAIDTDAGTLEARAAIVTLPLPLLRTFPVDPPLQLHREAAIALGTGHVARVVLHFRERRWPEDTSFLHAVEAPFPTFWALGHGKVPMMVAWAGGPRAERVLAHPPEERGRIAVQSLARALGDDSLEQHLLVSHHHDWRADPFAHGAYSWVPTGAEDAKRALATPFESTVFFAGEAAHPCAGIGTVHGAIESGEHAAREVLARVSW